MNSVLLARHGSTHLQFQLLRKMRQEYHKFKASIGNLARSCLKTKSRGGAWEPSSMVKALVKHAKCPGFHPSRNHEGTGEGGERRQGKVKKKKEGRREGRRKKLQST